MENKTTRKIRNLCKYIHKALLPMLAEDFHTDYSELLRERDTSDIWRQFAIWLLVDSEYGLISLVKEKPIGLRLLNEIEEYKEIQKKKRIAIQQVAQLYIDDCKDIVASKVAYDFAIRLRNDCILGNCYTGNSELLTAVALCALAASDDISTYLAKSISVAASVSSDSDAHYERMANKLIELLQAAPLMEFETEEEKKRHSEVEAEIQRHAKNFNAE